MGLNEDVRRAARLYTEGQELMASSVALKKAGDAVQEVAAPAEGSSRSVDAVGRGSAGFRLEERVEVGTEWWQTRGGYSILEKDEVGGTF